MSNTHSLDLESGGTQYAAITDASQTGLDLSGDFTIEFWINFESTPTSGNLMTLISKDDAASNRSYTFWLNNNSGTLRLEVYISDDGEFSAPDHQAYYWNWTPSTGTWYHVALVCDISEAAATTFELFIDLASQGNGTAIASNDLASIYNGTADFRVGVSGNSLNPADGKLNSVRVWSDPRTSTEISDNWKTSQPEGDNLQGSWYYNADHNDDSAIGNNLTANGTPAFSTDIPYVDAKLDLTSKRW